jgi:hypothetical protein
VLVGQLYRCDSVARASLVRRGVSREGEVESRVEEGLRNASYPPLKHCRIVLFCEVLMDFFFNFQTKDSGLEL